MTNECESEVGYYRDIKPDEGNLIITACIHVYHQKGDKGNIMDGQGDLQRCATP